MESAVFTTKAVDSTRKALPHLFSVLFVVTSSSFRTSTLRCECRRAMYRARFAALCTVSAVSQMSAAVEKSIATSPTGLAWDGLSCTMSSNCPYSHSDDSATCRQREAARARQ